MNKQELIESITHLPSDCSGPRPMIDKLTTLELIKLLDEPEKVKIPQFVANWIEHFKKTGDWDLFQAMDYLFEHTITCEWIETKNNQELFARAWIEGYEVEKEKRYWVKMKGIEKEKCYLNYNFGGVWLFYNQENFYGYRAHHTRKELEEAGFGWVFNCPGIEIEEVTE